MSGIRFAPFAWTQDNGEVFFVYRYNIGMYNYIIYNNYKKFNTFIVNSILKTAVNRKKLLFSKSNLNGFALKFSRKPRSKQKKSNCISIYVVIISFTNNCLVQL